jgi:hypothetical protein
VIRQLLSQSAVIAIVLLGACDDGANEVRRMAAAQNEVDSRIIAIAIADASQKAKQAQRDADNKIALVKESFLKARENYRHMVKTNLIDLDRSVAELEDQAKAAPAQARGEAQAVLRQIRTRRETYANNLTSLEAETVATWDDAKARMDKEWSALEELVETD